MEKSPSWSRAHDWKSCRPLKGLEGSNPSFSATESLGTVRFQGFPFLRPASVFAAGKPLGGTKERHLLLADVSLSWQGVTIQILSGRSNSLAFKFAIFLEKHLTGLLAGSAFAPYKRFTTGKTLAQGEFTSPEHLDPLWDPRQTCLPGSRQEENAYPGHRPAAHRSLHGRS